MYHLLHCTKDRYLAMLICETRLSMSLQDIWIDQINIVLQFNEQGKLTKKSPYFTPSISSVSCSLARIPSEPLS